MAAVTSESTADLGVHAGTAEPCLIAAPWGARIVSLLFLASLVLFGLAVLTLGPLQ